MDWHWANHKYPQIYTGFFLCQHILQYTNVGSTSNTQIPTVHTNISIIEPTSDQHYILVLNTKWLIFMSTLVRWTNVGPTLYVQQGIGHDSCQHLLQWTNIAYPTPMDKLSCQHIIRWTIFINVGPTFKLRRQQSTNHSTNNLRRPDAVFLSWMSTDKNRVHYFEAKLLHPCARFNLFLSKWL